MFQDEVVLWMFGWSNYPIESMRNTIAAYLNDGGGMLMMVGKSAGILRG